MWGRPAVERDSRMVSTAEARSSLGHRTHIVSPLNIPGLCRAFATIVVLGMGLPSPCLGQRLATTPVFDTWSSLEVRQPTPDIKLPVDPQRETYKSLGSWIGFGLGVGAVPFVWSACDCADGEKTLLVAPLIIGGTVLGGLIGKQFKKTVTAADSASVAPQN